MALYNVEFTMTITVNANSKDEADDRAWEYVNTGVLDITDCYTYVTEAEA